MCVTNTTYVENKKKLRDILAGSMKERGSCLDLAAGGILIVGLILKRVT
jgi:hypothetical protein